MNTYNNISCCWMDKTTKSHNSCTVLLLIISAQILSNIGILTEVLCLVSLCVSDSWGFPNSPGNHLSVIHTYVHTYPTYFVFRSHQLCAHSSTKQVTICPKIPHVFVVYVHPEIRLIYLLQWAYTFVQENGNHN